MQKNELGPLSYKKISSGWTKDLSARPETAGSRRAQAASSLTPVLAMSLGSDPQKQRQEKQK